MGSISGHTLNLRFVQGSGFTRSLRPIRDWGSMDREGMQQPGSRVQENRSEDTLGALEVPLALSYAVRPRPASKSCLQERTPKLAVTNQLNHRRSTDLGRCRDRAASSW
ncbi:hypothetical protein DAI22_01g301700 [Oryza sativa Japonica Group]|nr:hypothetical protein DAI22_01g301700 [Oryza sativa Japonica Group]